MAGFRTPEIAREQMVLWAQRLEDAVPADHPVRQVDRLSEALASIARRRQEQVSGAGPRPIASVTDPSSRVMPDKEGQRKPNYNAQIAADTAAGMIVAEEVNDRAEDSGQLTPLLEQVAAHCGRLPQEASADSQYNTGVEPRFGQIKRGLGVRRFLHRGLAAVQAEWSLICTAVNVGILLRPWPEVARVL